MIELVTIPLRHERDSVSARGAARHAARLLGFEHQDQIRIATAVSELTRAAAAGGQVGPAAARLAVDGATRPQRLVISVTGEHPGEASAETSSARGGALLAARRLLDDHGDAADGSAGVVSLGIALPPGAPHVDAARAREVGAAIESLDAAAVGGYLGELKQQNRELSSTLLELEKKQRELERLNAELADTNRGVMALYAELDERANHLRQADEIKTRFLSYMSHEFRTPLSSILALSNMLLERIDGPLTPEQAKQVRLIRDSSSELFELVSDLLDLAKVEAGKVGLSIGRFTVDDLFGALRGMLRPLARSPSVSLDFEPASTIPPILGDEGKIAQVLRNFLSNALKFTESGRVRVSAGVLKRGETPPGRDVPVDRECVLFRVDDTGIGIAKQDQAAIFEEFTQVSHTLQKGVRGTGLGLPLCRKLASLMGGEVWVDSDLGAGSTFHLLVPRFHRPAFEPLAASGSPLGARREEAADAGGLPLLLVSDLGTHRRALEELFADSGFAPVPCSGADVSADLLSALQPCAAVVHVSADLADETDHPPRVVQWLRQAGIPVIRASVADGAGVSGEGTAGVSGEGTAGESGAGPAGESAADAAAATGPAPGFDGALVGAAYAAALRDKLRRVLVVDDDPAFLEILSRRLEPYCRECVTQQSAAQALAAAIDGDFDCAVLDLVMPGEDGFALLARLRDDEATERLPVLVSSSRTPSADEWALLRQMGAAFVPKSALEPGSLGRGLLEACRRASGGVSRVAAGEAVGMR